MALPSLKKAGIEQATTQEVANTPMNVEQEVLKLGKSIQQSSSLGLQAATQAVVGNVPAMIRDLTDDIKSGSISNFATAMNKLITLTEDLGINLRDYNEELADTVERFTGDQAKLQEELHKLREQGIKAEIDEDGKRIRMLTQNDIVEYNRQRQVNDESIAKNREDIETRTKLLNLTDKQLEDDGKKRKVIEDEIKTRAKNIEGLEKENEGIDKKTSTTADTGRDQGFGKFQELKEAFMVIPDTIGEAMTSFSKAGKGVFTGLTSLFKKGGLAKAFKGLVNFFKTARIMIAGVFLLVVAAIQFVAERIDKIAAFFGKIWDRITGFFKAIGEWFSNSWLGKKLGLGKDDDGETDTRLEKEKAKSYDQMDDGTYAIGNDGADIYDENKVNEFLAPSKDASNAPVVDFDGRIIQPGEEGYERARANRTQNTQSYMDDYNSTNEINQLKKDVSGDKFKDGTTSSMLKSLESESNNIKPPTVINVQNNATSNNAQSSSTNVSGFLDHEPETTLKYVKQGSTGSADF